MFHRGAADRDCAVTADLILIDAPLRYIRIAFVTGELLKLTMRKGFIYFVLGCGQFLATGS